MELHAVSDTASVGESFAALPTRAADKSSSARAAVTSLRIAGLIVAYAVLSMLFTWPLVAHLGTAVVAPVDPTDTVWRIDRAQSQFLHDPRNLFQSNTYYPYARSYLFDELVLGAALLTLPLRLLTNNPVAIYNLATLASLALSGLAMYALARRLRCHPAGAFAAGLIYAFAPLQMVHFGQHSGHLTLLSGQWFPLVILLLDRLFERPRWYDALSLAAVLIMQSLSSQYYAFYLAFVVVGFIGLRLVQLGVRRRFPAPATWGLLAVAGVLTLTAVLPIGMNYVLVQREHGFARPIGENAYWSSNLGSLLSADGQNWLWGRLTAPVRVHSGQVAARHLFPGLLALVLGTLGAFAGRRRWLPQYLVLLGLGAIVLAFGPRLYLSADRNSVIFAPLPYQFLYEHVPGFDSMRVPARFGRLFTLGLAPLAGVGLTWLIDRFRREGWNYGLSLRVALVSLVLLGIGVESLNKPYKLTPVPTGEQIPPVYRWLATLPPGAMVELPFLVPNNEDRIGINARYRYFTIYHPHHILNGSDGVVPKAYRALASELQPGPTARSLSILQGLGVDYLVVHYDDVRLEQGRKIAEETWASLASATDQVRQIADFGDTVVYQLLPAERFAALRAAVPRDATVYLSREDPFGTYGAMLAWVLRGDSTEIRTRVRVRFGGAYAGPPDPEARYDYAILYRQEDPANVGFAGATVVWEDDVVRVYRR